MQPTRHCADLGTMWTVAGARSWISGCAPGKFSARGCRYSRVVTGAVAVGTCSMCYASTSWPALAQSGAQGSAFDERGRPSDPLVRKAQQWVERRRKTGDSHGAEEWVQLVETTAAAPMAGKRVLIFVNPECGAKTAQAHCDDIVRPMLSALGCVSAEVQQTDDKKAAMELLESADLSGIDAV